MPKTKQRALPSSLRCKESSGIVRDKLLGLKVVSSFGGVGEITHYYSQYDEVVIRANNYRERCYVKDIRGANSRDRPRWLKDPV